MSKKEILEIKIQKASLTEEEISKIEEETKEPYKVNNVIVTVDNNAMLELIKREIENKMKEITGKKVELYLTFREK